MDHPWFTVNRLWIGHLTLQPQLGISLGKYSSSLWETSSTIFLKLCPTLPASVRQHQLPFPCWIWTSFICKNYANTETHNQAKSRARKLLYERWKLPFVDHSEGAWLCPLSHSTKSLKGTVFFFSYFGDDDPWHIEITCITLNKLLNQRQNWGTKPGFSNFKGQSFNHYASMSLWLGASSDSALYHSAQIPEWLCSWYLSVDYASLGLWYLLPLIIPLLSTGPHKAGCSSTLHLGHAHPVSGIHLSQPWGWCTPNRLLHKQLPDNFITVLY